MRQLSGYVAGLALIGCSTSSGGQGGPTQQTCAQSGSFTISVSEGSGLNGSLDACACSPSTLSLTVNWGADGSATVNGQSCGAYCYSPTTGTAGLCRDVGKPPVGSDCFIEITCCNSYLQDAGDIPKCTTNGQTVGGVQFYALSGGPSQVKMLPAYTASYAGCQCSYCSQDTAEAGVSCK